MQTIYPYQTRFAISNLTILAERLETDGCPQWFALASSAACLESMLKGATPIDVADVSLRLKNLSIPNPFPRQNGRSIYHAVSMAIALIDGHRFGLIYIQPESTCYESQPVWIGLDKGTGDRTVYADGRLLNDLRDDVEHIDNPANQLTEQHLGQLLADPQQNLTHNVAPCDDLKEANLRPATSDARRYDQSCSEVRHA